MFSSASENIVHSRHYCHHFVDEDQRDSDLPDKVTQGGSVRAKTDLSLSESQPPGFPEFH